MRFCCKLNFAANCVCLYLFYQMEIKTQAKSWISAVLTLILNDVLCKYPDVNPSVSVVAMVQMCCRFKRKPQQCIAAVASSCAGKVPFRIFAHSNTCKSWYLHIKTLAKIENLHIYPNTCKNWYVHIQMQKSNIIRPLNTCKTSSQAPSYASPKLWISHLLTGVRCRATSVAKKYSNAIQMS